MYKNIEAEVHRQKAEVKFIDFMICLVLKKVYRKSKQNQVQ